MANQKRQIPAIPYEVEILTTGDNYLQFPSGFPMDKRVAKLTTTEGDAVKFNNIGAASLSNISYAVDESVLLTIVEGYDLSFNGTVGSKFKVEI